MKQSDIPSLLRNRLSERDDAFNDALLSVQGVMSSRGMLQSSIALKEFHRSAKEELAERVKVIAQSIIDEIEAGSIPDDRTASERIAKGALQLSFSRVKDKFNRFTHNISSGLLNQQIKGPFTDLDSLWDSKLGELENLLLKEWKRIDRSKGATYLDRMKYYWADHPIAAPIILVFIAIAAIISIGSVLLSVWQ